MKAKDTLSIAKQSFQEWTEDRAPNEAAALAYYTLLSVPALLLLIQWVLGRVVGSDAQTRVIDFVQQAVRGSGGEAITAMIQNADSPGGGLASIISLVTLSISATGVLVQLEQSLNRIWGITEEDAGVVAKIRERAFSLLLVLGLGAFLLLSVTVTTAVSGFAETMAGELPVGEWAVYLVNVPVSFLLLTLLFGAALRIIPDAEVAWSDVWLGAAVTAVLFIVGQYALSFYLGKSAPGSAYGVAGSIVAFVVWVYYSALILFLGAEFTQVYANRFGSRIRPDDSAVLLAEQTGQEQAAAVGDEAARRPRPEPGAMHAAGRPDYDAFPRRPAPQRPAERETDPLDALRYYVVALLALGIGLWRLLRRNR